MGAGRVKKKESDEMRRRDFLAAAGSSMAWAGMASANPTSGVNDVDQGDPSGSSQTSVHVKGDVITIHTHTQSAVIEKGFLVSLISKQTGEEFADLAVYEPSLCQ